MWNVSGNDVVYLFPLNQKSEVKYYYERGIFLLTRRKCMLHSRIHVYMSTYGVNSSVRKGEPSVIRVYTKVPSMTTPKMLKRILRVPTIEHLVFGSVPLLYRKHQITLELMVKIKTLNLKSYGKLK